MLANNGFVKRLAYRLLVVCRFLDTRSGYRGQPVKEAAAPEPALGGFVAAQFLLELLDPEEQLVDVALTAHQPGVHRGGGLQLLLDAVPTAHVLNRDRGLLREGLEL